jgi:hypothetical protein
MLMCRGFCMLDGESLAHEAACLVDTIYSVSRQLYVLQH